MSEFGELSVHPIADQFPRLTGEAYEHLVKDIKANGLQQPIMLDASGEVLIDGRIRLLACKEAHVEPRYDRLPKHFTEEQIISYIISANIHRRHLTAGQRAMIGVVVEREFAKHTQEREKNRKMGIGGTVVDLPGSKASSDDQRSREAAAAAVGVSGTYIQRAKLIATHAPGTAERVRKGEISLNSAFSVTTSNGGVSDVDTFARQFLESVNAIPSATVKSNLETIFDHLDWLEPELVPDIRGALENVAERFRAFADELQATAAEIYKEASEGQRVYGSALPTRYLGLRGTIPLVHSPERVDRCSPLLTRTH